MKYRTLGKTGIRVSELTIGTWQLGGPLFFNGKPDGHPDPGKTAVIRMIRGLGDAGINAIDTAEQYSDGESERRTGEAVRGMRDRWVISTKFGFRVGPGGTRIDDSSPATILSSLEGSLRRLGTDYIDIYLYHCAPRTDDIDAGREILEQAKAQGKIRSYGISTENPDLVETLIRRQSVEIVQFASSLLAPARKTSALAAEYQLGTQIRGVMAQGRLSGKYFQKPPQWSTDDNRSEWLKNCDCQAYSALMEAVPPGFTMAQVTLRIALDSPGHHTVCLGAKNMEDYRAAIAALDLPPLKDETIHRLRTIAGTLPR